MPSVLAEISFVSHRQEGQLLKTSAYRQQIAEALFDAIVKYQKSLKAQGDDRLARELTSGPSQAYCGVMRSASESGTGSRL